MKSDTPQKRPAITPRARRLAAESGVDTSLLVNSSGQRIAESDVLSAIQPIHDQQHLASRLRSQVDTTAALRLSHQLRLQSRPGEEAPNLGDMLIRAAAEALPLHPELCSEAGEQVSLGIGLLTSRYLVWPVLDVPRSLPLRKLANQHRDLRDLARADRLPPTSRASSLFVMDAGQWRMDEICVPLHRHPRACLSLGQIIGQAAEEPSSPEGRSASHATLQLAFDAEQVSPPTAARFLDEVRSLMEQPEWMAG